MNIRSVAVWAVSASVVLLGPQTGEAQEQRDAFDAEGVGEVEQQAQVGGMNDRPTGGQQSQAHQVEEVEIEVEEVEVDDIDVKTQSGGKHGHRRSSAPKRSEGPKFAIQSRVLVNLFGFAGGLTIDAAAAPGVLFADERVFVGLGVYGFGIEKESHGVAGTPTFTVDFLQTDWASLHFVSWIPIGTLIQDPDEGENSTAPFVGVNAGIGVKGRITEGISIGAEWGWGFSYFFENAEDTDLFERDTQFIHSTFGSILFEASIGRGGERMARNNR